MATSFKKMSELNPRILMIVDSLNMAFRWKHKGQHEFMEDYFRTIESFRKSYSAGKVIITADKGSSSFRKNLLPEYKGNREELRSKQTPEEEAEFMLFFEEFNAVIDSYKETTHYPTFRFDKVEADDIGAYIVKNIHKYPIDKVILISSDRDWDTLVTNNVSRFSYVTRKEVTLENWNSHYECTQEEYISIKCLQGDSGDNVPGVDGIGPKKALALVQEYGSAYDIAANLPIASKYKHIQNLNAFGKDALLRNYQLMDILEFCDEAIGADNCKEIDETLTKYLNGTIN
jgi:5'-3' exonuclease